MADRAVGMNSVVRALHDPHSAAAGRFPNPPPTLDERLPAEELFERSSVLDEPSISKSVTAKARGAWRDVLVPKPVLVVEIIVMPSS